MSNFFPKFCVVFFFISSKCRLKRYKFPLNYVNIYSKFRLNLRLKRFLLLFWIMSKFLLNYVQISSKFPLNSCDLFLYSWENRLAARNRIAWPRYHPVSLLAGVLGPRMLILQTINTAIHINQDKISRAHQRQEDQQH